MIEKRRKIEIRFHGKDAMILKECISISIWEISHNLADQVLYSIMFPNYDYYHIKSSNMC